MAYLENMRATCKSRGTRPEHALDLLDSIRGEFDKSFEGGIFDPGYALSKLNCLREHLLWLNEEAKKEGAARCGK